MTSQFDICHWISDDVELNASDVYVFVGRFPRDGGDHQCDVRR